MVKVVIWGSRGSVPGYMTQGQEKLKLKRGIEEYVKRGGGDVEGFLDGYEEGRVYGVSTPCVQLEVEGEGRFILCDGGTGIRDFVMEYRKREGVEPEGEFHIFLSHLHWDHIQGLPFFMPLYKEGNRVVVHTCHEETERALRVLFSGPFFPVEYKDLKARIEIDVRKEGEVIRLGDMEVRMRKQRHPGVSYGYRFEVGGKVVVYGTDCELKEEDMKAGGYIDFVRGADVLILDTQYSYLETVYDKLNWGHTSNLLGVELASLAEVDKLVLFHLEPSMDDGVLDEFLKKTQTYAKIYNEKPEQVYPRVIMAGYGGMELEA